MTAPPVVRRTVAGVPVVIRAPAGLVGWPRQAPLLVLWHGFESPADEDQLAEAVPLDELPVWRAYLGLPLLGHRLPRGGVGDLARRRDEDFLCRLLYPVVDGAVRELPGVLAALRSDLGLSGDVPLGLFGASFGATAALLALAEPGLRVRAAVLVGAAKDVSAPMAWAGAGTGRPYLWRYASRVQAARLDFVRRASEIAGATPPALLFLAAAGDAAVPAEDSRELVAALRGHYQQPDRLSLAVLPQLGADLSAGSAGAAVIERHAQDWFARHLAHSS